MTDIKQYLEETNTVLLTKKAFEYLKKRANVLDKTKAEYEPSGDLISREETLIAFADYVGSGMSMDDYDALWDIVAKMPPALRWIPVSERLPEDKQSVLVWCPQYKNIYCAYLEKEQWWIFGAFVQIVPNEVVAWMPLPEPYEAESEE